MYSFGKQREKIWGEGHFNTIWGPGGGKNRGECLAFTQFILTRVFYEDNTG